MWPSKKWQSQLQGKTNQPTSQTGIVFNNKRRGAAAGRPGAGNAFQIISLTFYFYGNCLSFYIHLLLHNFFFFCFFGILDAFNLRRPLDSWPVDGWLGSSPFFWMFVRLAYLCRILPLGKILFLRLQVTFGVGLPEAEHSMRTDEPFLTCKCPPVLMWWILGGTAKRTQSKNKYSKKTPQNKTETGRKWMEKHIRNGQ